MLVKIRDLIGRHSAQRWLSLVFLIWLLTAGAIPVLAEATVVSSGQGGAANDFALIVGATVIPLKQFETALTETKKQLGEEGVDLATAEGRQMLAIAAGSVVDDFVQRALVEQAAAARHLAISQAEIDQKIEALAGTAGEPKAAAQGALSPGDLRQSVQDEILLDKLQASLFPRVIVSQTEARKYYEANTGLFRQSPRWHILAWQFTSQTAAEKGLAKLQAGKHPAGIKTQDLGFVEEGQLDPALEDVAQALKPGALSGVVALPDDYYVLKLLEYTPAQVVPLDQVKEQIKEFLAQIKRQKMFQDWLKDQRQNTKVIVRPGLVPEVGS